MALVHGLCEQARSLSQRLSKSAVVACAVECIIRTFSSVAFARGPFPVAYCMGPFHRVILTQVSFSYSHLLVLWAYDCSLGICRL